MKNRKTRIAIILEVKKRELPFLSILQEILARKGYTVKLIPFRVLCTWRLLLFRPDIVVVNGLRHEFPYFISQVFMPKKLFKSKIACYYSEQVGYYDESIAFTYNNKIIFDNVDYHISWGPRFTADLLKLGVPKEKLWYIGSLQYDIDKYFVESSESIKQRLSDKYGAPYDKKWILYADNIIRNYQPEGLYEVRRTDTFNMIKKVASINPDSFVIYRPHPETPEAEINDAINSFSEYANVAVISEGHIFDWTCAASALIIWNSTSSLQAMFMGLSVFGFMTSDGKNMENYWYKDIFPTYTDSEALADALSKDLRGDRYDGADAYAQNRADFIKEWYYKKDGFAFDRFCNLINVVEKDQFRPLSSGLDYGSLSVIRVLLRELRRFAGNLIHGRIDGMNVTKKEVSEELRKYDMSRFEDRSFDVKESDRGASLE